MNARQATYTFAPEEHHRREGFRLLNVFHFMASLLLAGLFILVLVGGVILYKEYRFYLKLRQEVDFLSH